MTELDFERTIEDLKADIIAAFPKEKRDVIYGYPGRQDDLVFRLNHVPREDLSDDDLELYGWSSIGSDEQWLYFLPEFLVRSLDRGPRLMETVWHKIDTRGLLGATDQSKEYAKYATRHPLPAPFTPTQAELIQRTIDVIWCSSVAKDNVYHACELFRCAAALGLFPRSLVWQRTSIEILKGIIWETDPNAKNYVLIANQLGTDEVGEVLLGQAEAIQPEWQVETLWALYQKLAETRRAIFSL